MKQMIGVLLLALLSGHGLAQDQPAVKGSPSGRIVSGTEVDIADYPYIVGLYDRGVFFCGGGIITMKHVLTAAHCFAASRDYRNLNVVGGSSQLNNGTIFTVAGFIVHPQFSLATTNNDAAIMQINESFEGHTHIAPIALRTKDVTYSPTNPTWCAVIGWGYVSGKSTQASMQLNMAWMQVISQYECAKQWSFPSNITAKSFCAELPETDACRGDSGGPVVCDGKLAAIVSWGDQYCAGTKPSIFAKVGIRSIRQFIRDWAKI